MFTWWIITFIASQWTFFEHMDWIKIYFFALMIKIFAQLFAVYKNNLKLLWSHIVAHLYIVEVLDVSIMII